MITFAGWDNGARELFKVVEIGALPERAWCILSGSNIRCFPHMAKRSRLRLTSSPAKRLSRSSPGFSARSSEEAPLLVLMMICRFEDLCA